MSWDQRYAAVDVPPLEAVARRCCRVYYRSAHRRHCAAGVTAPSAAVVRSSDVGVPDSSGRSAALTPCRTGPYPADRRRAGLIPNSPLPVAERAMPDVVRCCSAKYSSTLVQGAVQPSRQRAIPAAGEERSCDPRHDALRARISNCLEADALPSLGRFAAERAPCVQRPADGGREGSGVGCRRLPAWSPHA